MLYTQSKIWTRRVFNIKIAHLDILRRKWRIKYILKGCLLYHYHSFFSKDCKDGLFNPKAISVVHPKSVESEIKKTKNLTWNNVNLTMVLL